MALRTFVKINSITHLTDARYCAGMDVSVLGFSLETGSSNYVAPSQFQEISGWISGIELCGEFNALSSSEIRAILSQYPGITWIQHDDLPSLLEFANQEYELIWKVDLDSVEQYLSRNTLNLDGIQIHLLLTNDSNLSDKSIPSTISDLAQNFKIIYGGTITPDSVETLLSSLPLSGLALDGGEEIKPGLRDFDQMADILESLEIED